MRLGILLLISGVSNDELFFLGLFIFYFSFSGTCGSSMEIMYHIFFQLLFHILVPALVSFPSPVPNPFSWCTLLLSNFILLSLVHLSSINSNKKNKSIPKTYTINSTMAPYLILSPSQWRAAHGNKARPKAAG